MQRVLAFEVTSAKNLHCLQLAYLACELWHIVIFELRGYMFNFDTGRPCVVRSGGSSTHAACGLHDSRKLVDFTGGLTATTP
jgi:hypothetical protein